MKHHHITRILLIFLAWIALFTLVVACGSQPSEEQETKSGESEDFLSDLPDLLPVELSEGGKLRVVATTSIVADIVSEVGNGSIELTALMPANVDPHSYEPTPADLRAVSEAHVVFVNGLGLEEFLEEMLENVGTGVPVISLSAGLDALSFGEEFEGEDQASEHPDEEHNHGTYDPHVWFDPTNVMVWATRVGQALSLLDPEDVSFFERNVEQYHEQLRQLDQWIFVKVSELPEGDRKLVTDHRVFGYFAARYGFEIIGAVIPVFSSAAEPSAREIAELQESILDENIDVIFVGEFINPKTVEAIVKDTGIELVPLYTGALSEEEGPAGNYLAFMRYNVQSIVDALLE